MVFGAAVGVVVTLPALFLAALSSGAGHGDYFAARAFFPVPMCIAAFLTNQIGASAIALACIQFPLYGSVIGYWAAAPSRRRLIGIGVIALLHLVAFAACSESSAFN